MKQSVNCRAGLQLRGTSPSWRNGLTGTSWRAMKGNPVSCHWVGITIGTSTVSGLTSWKWLGGKRPGSSDGKPVCHEPAVCAENPLQIRLQGEDQFLPVEWGDPSALASTGEIHMEFWVQVWVPQCKRLKDTLEVWREDPSRRWKTGTWCMRKHWEKLACSAWKKKGFREDFIANFH